MEYPFTVPGYESVPLTLQTGWGASKILYQGVPLKKTGARSFELAFSDGSVLPLTLKGGGYDMSVKVYHGDQMIPVIPPLPWWANLLIYFPLILIFIGGAIGGLCGGLAAASNAMIVRGNMNAALKVVLCLVVGFAAALVWLIAAVAINLAIHPAHAS